MNEEFDTLLHEFHAEVHHAAQIPAHDQDRNAKAGLRIRDVKQRFRDLFASAPQRHGREVTDGSTIYLLMVNELDMDGHSFDRVQDAYSTRAQAEEAMTQRVARYQGRLARMTDTQRHRHTIESYSIDDVTLTAALGGGEEEE